MGSIEGKESVNIAPALIAELLPVIIYQATLPEFATTYIGSSVTRLLGFSQEELAGGIWTRYIHAEDKARVEAELAEAIARGDGFSIRYRFWNKDRSAFRWFDDCGVFEPDSRGGPTRVCGVMLDITEMQQLSESLAASESRYRSVFQRSPLPMWVYDLDTLRFLLVNEAAIRHYGYSQEEFARMTLLDIRPDEDHEALIKEVSRRPAGLHESGVWRHRKRNGEIIDVRIASHSIDFGGRQCELILANDVTEQLRAAHRAEQMADTAKRALVDTIEVLGGAMELRDPYTAGHQVRVAELACAIGREMRLGPEQLEGLRLAGLVHDIGKIAVPSELLVMPRALQGAERKLIQEHALAGYKLLNNIAFPWPVARVVREHHERLDGSGYPDGLRGDEILLEARVIAVADVVEAMVTHRPYRPSRGLNAAMATITEGRGTKYDPAVVDACLAVLAAGTFKIPAAPQE